MKLIMELDLQYILSLVAVGLLVYMVVNAAWKRRTDPHDWKGKERE